jgi:hypothetical protein
MFIDISWDRETTGLLDETAIDYTQSPYKLRDTFKTNCIVVEEHQTGKIIAFYDGPKYILDGRRYEEKGEHGTYILENYVPQEYEHHPLKAFKEYVLKTNIRKVVAHNQINFDLLVGKLEEDMDYTIEADTWCGKEVEFEDTLVLSKTLNPDRFGGHSLEKLSEKVSIQKIDFRKHMPADIRFLEFAADELYYCIYDVKANTQVYYYLDKEREGWDWKDAISLEKSVAELITRQTHRGFKFDKELAEKNVKELDALMEERRLRVEPVLPKRPATKAFMKDFTPPVRQFKKDRSVAADLVKFADKVGAELKLDEENVPVEFIFQGKSYSLPLKTEPLVTEMDATIDDTTHIKEWLCSLGWSPQEYKEKDLSTDTKKIKLIHEKLVAAIDRYVAQTLASNFCDDRCDHLDTTRQKLKSALMKRAESGRAIKVLTNPSFTVGQDKEMDPGLEVIAEKFPFVRDVVEYLTYKHRRNSILGGGLEWDEDEEPEKGYIASVRQDGRIPTPADTCGAATSRMKHRLVANIPRVTSLYGEPMREMFCVDDGYYQIGYDFDSLEAREEAHYCWKYEQGSKEYCNSLLMDKPFDVHTMMAKRITEIIGREFGRSPAKNVKYGCTYGAQAKKVAKTIGSDIRVGEMVFSAFWEAAAPLDQLKKRLAAYWENQGGKKFILGLDGRKVPTRSAHAILNSLFQSAGVLCAKRAMVIHDRKLKAEGLDVDFFREDWKNKTFCQQLIAYHDEAQIEVKRELVQFKMFATQEEAQAFKDASDKIWSDIKPNKNGGVFIAYSRPGELAAQAVKEAGEYYNLNVELTAGYMVHRNWAGCH